MNTSCENALLSVPPNQWQVDQVIVFDWHDGPNEGICRMTKPSCHFYFSLLAQRRCPHNLDERLFSVSEISVEVFQRCQNLLKCLGIMRSPIWAPIWTGNNIAALGNEIDEILNEQRLTNLILLTKDMVTFEGIYEVDYSKNGSKEIEGKIRNDWFLKLGL